MRTVTLFALGNFVLLLTAWTAAGATPTPPKCSPTDTQREATLTTGTFPRGAGYATFCGPGGAVMELGGRSFTIRGGHCGHAGSTRWVAFGVIASGPLGSGARGFSMVLEPGNRPGHVNVIDSIIQVAGLDLSPTGSAVVAKGLKSGTFTLTPIKGSALTRVTGSWTCI